MAINAPFGSKKEFKIQPAGNHIARVYSVIHLGIQAEEYMGEEKLMDKVRIGFELPLENTVFKEGDEPKPFTISQEYTLSMGDKANLRKLVEGMIGHGLLEQDAVSFDVLDLMGRACMLNVIHKTSAKGNEYAQIVGAAPLPKGIDAPIQVNRAFIFDFEENFSDEKLERLPDFIKDKIKGSMDYKRLTGQAIPYRSDRTPEEGKEYRSSIEGTITYPDEINPDDVPF